MKRKTLRTVCYYTFLCAIVYVSLRYVLPADIHNLFGR